MKKTFNVDDKLFKRLGLLAVRQRIRRPCVWALKPWYATRRMSASGSGRFGAWRTRRSQAPGTAVANEGWPDGPGGHFRVDSYLAGQPPYLAELGRLLGLDESRGTSWSMENSSLATGRPAGSCWLPTSGCIKWPWSFTVTLSGSFAMRPRGPRRGLDRCSPPSVRYCGAIAVMDGRPTFLRGG